MKHKKKPMLSILLTIVMIINLFISTTVTVLATETADGADLVISTLEDLKAFSAAVDSGDTYSGKTVVLNNNIDASADDWNPIGTDAAAFSGTFDGQGNAVTIKINTENTYQGFFAKNAGTIENLSVRGSIVGKSYLGGIAGYNAGTITNCKNYADVSGLFKGSSNVAGITGYCYVSAIVENCGNYGPISIRQPIDDVSGSAHNLAGIAGNCLTNAIVTGCYNMGTITGHLGYVGGVVGYELGKAENCYNKGKVFSANEKNTKTIGGVAGVIMGAGNIANCYNIGEISVTNGDCGAIAGTATAGKFSNCYYLNGTAKYGISSLSNTTGAKTMDEMKSADFPASLSTAFSSDFAGSNSTNNGYPILSWQKAGDEPTEVPVATHTVTFLVNDTIYKTVTVDEGEPVVPAADPTKEGCTFRYWSDSKDGTAYDFTTPITKDIILYAIFDDAPTTVATVTFMSNDTPFKTIEVELGKTVSEPEAPTLDGYNFMYWSAVKNGAEFDFETAITGNIILYAVWEEANNGSGGFEYQVIDNGTAVKITKYIGKEQYVTVPEAIYTHENNNEGLPVTIIGNETFENTDIIEVELPKTITTIEDGMNSATEGVIGTFAYCKQLTTVNMRNTVIQRIGDCAFYGVGSDSLLNINYPNTLKEIGDFAFACCNSIVTLSLPNSVTKIGNSAFYQSRRLSKLDIPGVSDIEANAFTETIFEENYENLWESGNFSGIVYAGGVAYMYMGNMAADTKLVVEDGTLGISEFLFENRFTTKTSCRSNLQTITVPDTVKYIAADMFNGFNAVTDGDFVGVDMFCFTDSYAQSYASKYNNIRFNSIGQSSGEIDYDYKWYDDHVKTDKHYVITNAAGLWGLADLLDTGEADFAGETVYIGKDIDLGGISSIGYGITANQWHSLEGFKGVMDGQGYTISGVYIFNPAADKQGLFGELTTAVTIKKLNITGKVTGCDYVGGLVGKLSSAGAIIENCSFSGTVIGNGSDGYVGGLIGHATKAAVSNCTSSGTVSCNCSSRELETQLGATGGILGYNAGGTVKGCTSNASVTGNGYSIGGIVGQNMLATVSESKNYGAVSGYSHVGGIVGRNMASEVSNCRNYEIISGTTYVGGVAGTSIGVVSDKNIAVLGCVNTGSVTASQYAGGIMGYSEGSIVEKSYNEGGITADYYAGGLIALSKGFGISNAYNLGDVIASNNYAGGIAGYSNNEGKFTNCYNMGNIQSGDSKDFLATVYLNEEIFVNCYYLADKEDASNPNKVSKTAAAFENGEIATLLGDSFSQQIGIDKHPVLTEKIDECFIATAAYGSKFQPAVMLLRKFRDLHLLNNSLGTKFVRFYYQNSPPIARFIAGNEPLKFFVRALLTPIVGIVYLIFHPVLMGIALALVLMLVRRKFRKVIHT